MIDETIDAKRHTMNYISTRAQTDAACAISFEEALLAGLAPDGGLYMPTEWPRIMPEEIAHFAGQDFASVAARLLSMFTGDSFTDADLNIICQKAFSTFSHPATTPLVQVGDEDWILELFHGPTLAFKDVAMQVLGGMFEAVLQRKNRRLTIIGATSGDTGGAAIEALKGRAGIDVFILHPKGRISSVQRRIMTTSGADNIHNLAVSGTFDDCQAIVKSLFADRAFVDDVSLGGINSINWARIMVQSVYYFTASAALGGPARAFSFVVPTGNFGDIFAGYVAKKMGLPIDKLCVATNQNDIVHRVLVGGGYHPGTVTPTASPSMDIQVASNFERLIYEESGRDAALVRQLMGALKQSGGFDLPEDLHQKMGEHVVSGNANETETATMMQAHHKQMGMVIDPHTAVGRVVAQKVRKSCHLKGPVITLATAHPAKFPDAVKEAIGVHPNLPTEMSDLFERREIMVDCENDVADVRDYIRDHASAAKDTA